MKKLNLTPFKAQGKETYSIYNLSPSAQYNAIKNQHLGCAPLNYYYVMHELAESNAKFLEDGTKIEETQPEKKRSFFYASNKTEFTEQPFKCSFNILKFAEDLSKRGVSKTKGVFLGIDTLRRIN